MRSLLIANFWLLDLTIPAYIELWGLLYKKLKSDPHFVDTSHICLACDTLEGEENEEDNTGSEMKILRGHCNPVYSTQLLADNSGLLSCSEDMCTRYWDLVSFTNTVLYQGHAYPVWDMDVRPLQPVFCQWVP